MKTDQISGTEKKSSLVDKVSDVKDFLNSGPKGKVVESGVSSVLVRTVIKRLPPPFNYIPPFIVEKVVMTYGIDEGREVLLKGLRWIKKVTDEKPVSVIN